MSSDPTRNGRDAADLTKDQLAAIITQVHHGRSASPPDAGNAAKGDKPRPRAIPMSEIPDVEPVWLWKGYIQAGILLALSGEQSQGKSTLLLDLAARLTRGWDWPDGTPGGDPMNIMVVTAEDRATSVKRRMEAAGGDVENRCSVLPAVYGDRGQESVLTFPQDLPILEEEIREYEARFVIIDPIESLMSGTDTHKGGDVRRTLTRLAAIAERTDATFAYLGHPAKSATSANNAFGGSKAFVNAARAVFVVGPELGDTGRLVIAPTKVSEGRKPKGLIYTIESSIPGDDLAAPVIAWHGTTNQTADETACRPIESVSGPTAEDKACEIITGILSGGPIRATELEEQARRHGNIGRDAYKKARASLHSDGAIHSYPEGFPAVTWWKLSDSANTTSTPVHTGKFAKSPRQDGCTGQDLPQQSDPADDWPEPEAPSFRLDGPTRSRTI